MAQRTVRPDPRTSAAAAVKPGRHRPVPLVTRLRRRIGELMEENRRLKQTVQEYRELLFKTQRRRPPPDEELEPVLPKKRGAPRGHPGATRAKPLIINEEIEVPIRQCRHCGSEDLQRCQNYSDHLQEDIVWLPVKTTRYRHYVYYCRTCHKNTKAGPGPDELPGSYLGPRAKSLATFPHYHSGLSYGKVKQLFRLVFGLHVDKSSVYGFDNQARKKGAGLHREIKQGLRKSPYLHTDETGWRNEGKPYWLWCLAHPKLVCYHLDPKRNSKVVTGLVGPQYRGTMISDFLATYGKLPYTMQRCLVHLLRLIKRLKERFPRSARIREYCVLFDTLIHQVLTLHKQNRQRQISPREFLEFAAYLKARLKQLLEAPLPYPKADKTRRQLLKIRTELTTCLDHPEIPPHNNFVERQLRPNVILRKITFGTRSQSGMDNHQTLMSVIQTAAVNNYPLLELLHKTHARVKLSLAELQKPPPG